MDSHASTGPSDHAPRTMNPVLGHALSISLSPREYRLLHDRLAKRLSPRLRDRVISPDAFKAVAGSHNEYITTALRASVRAFLLTEAAANFLDLISKLITKKSQPARQGDILRISLAHSLFILSQRLLYRFFSRLRVNLRTEDARPFRKRNPRIAKALTSRYTPAIGGSLACFVLGLYPQAQLRLSAAIYMGTRSLEYLYNALRERGWFKNKPWWVGSWLLMPLSCAQLFHAFVFDRETIPKWLGDFILRYSPGYIQTCPEGFPTTLHWPDQFESVDALAEISRMKWPAFVSPILHPNIQNPLPLSLEGISLITSPAHPAVSSLSCALLHPKTPSCLTAFLQQNLLSIPLLVRSISKIAIALALVKIKNLLLHPIATTNSISRKVLSVTAVVSTAISSAWGSLCLFNNILPRSVLSTHRFYLSGALAGVPFMFFKAAGYRGFFLYFFRLAADSAWKSGVKRGLWRGWRGGELWLLAVSWAVVGMILERHPAAVTGPGIRKALAWVRGDGFTDPAESKTKKKGKRAVAGQS